MAAEIKPSQSLGNSRRGSVRKPQLISKLEGSTDEITAAVFIPTEDGVITSSSDRTVRVWLKRDTGQYWPSICETMPAPATSLVYNHASRQLFVGLDNGEIHEYVLAEDYNSISNKRVFLAHKGRVTSMVYSVNCQWILSCSRDKYFQYHCAESGQRLSGYQVNAWCTALQFDEESKYTFIGDYSGQITVLKIISRNKFDVITTLKGHTGSVRCLAWDAEKSLLFSASFDHSIIMWDIGGRQGNAYELQGHHDKVQSIVYAPQSKQLISGSDDQILALWDMAIRRQETPRWSESDLCEKCGVPFFWNMRAMFQMRCVGVRQHHCRKCGMAICDKCGESRSTIPQMGYEYEVRVCELCLSQISDVDRSPLATFHDSKHSISYMALNPNKKMVLTVGSDRIVKIWDVSTVLH